MSREHPYQEQALWSDLAFLHQESWLKNAAIFLRILKRSGRYGVVLTYADSTQPLRLRIRYIADYPTATKAQQSGEVFLRSVSRDPRGTFKIHIDDIDLCCN